MRHFSLGNGWRAVGMALALAGIRAVAGPGLEGEVGPHHRVVAAAPGRWEASSRAVEVASGLNYWDGRQWSPSEARFEERPSGGFVVEKVQHRVKLKANLNRAGSVEVTGLDGTVARSTPVGIRLFDTESGEAAVIGTLRDCQGEALDERRVIFRDAFDGVCASVVYTIDKGSFEQDVVLTSNINPEDYGFPAKTTRIQILTEFFDTRQPLRIVRPLYVEKDEAVRKRRAAPDFVDETLDFGEMVLGPGRAYTGVPDAQTPPVEAPVIKEYTTLEGRTFLIESVEFDGIKAGLEALPACGEQTLLPHRRDDHGRRVLAAVPPRVNAGEGEQAALAPARSGEAGLPRGVVVDYQLTVSGTYGATVFQGDTTYYVSGATFCNGATTIEAGAVFKYPLSTTTAYLQTGNTLTIKATPFRPAVFTAKDDDTVGESVTGSSGTPGTSYYANPALVLVYPYSSVVVSNCRFRYANVAIRYSGPVSGVAGTITHSQFYNCLRGVELQGCGCGSGTGFSVSLFNCLLTGVTAPVRTVLSGASYWAYYNDCTFDGLVGGAVTGTLGDGTAGGLAVYLTNTVVANVSGVGTSVTQSSGYNGFYNCSFGAGSAIGTSPVTAASTPFQKVGAGNYYLASGSNFRNVARATVLSSTWLADLQARTTDAPKQLAVGSGQTDPLAPVAVEDADFLDLGYHYDAMDYLVSQFPVPNSGTGTVLTGGVVVGAYGSYGFSVPEGGTVTGVGTPLSMNRLLWFAAVQEQPVALNTALSAVTTPATSGLFDVSGATSTSTSVNKPVISLRFTDLPMLGTTQNVFNATTYPFNLKTVTFTDCWLRGAGVKLSRTSLAGQNYLPSTAPLLKFSNNLLERSVFILNNGYNGAANNPLSLTFQNNTLWKGTLTLVYDPTGSASYPSWVFQDNLFDTVTLSLTGNGTYSTYVSRDFNAYYPNTSTTLSGSNDKLLTALSYGAVSAVGWNWYIASSTPPLMDLDTTRLAKDYGLFHYTISTSQAKEGTGQLDVGFHYVALSSNLPVDTDGDGVPDYLEDANGDGSSTGDLSDFNSADTDGDGLWDDVDPTPRTVQSPPTVSVTPAQCPVP